MARFPADKKVLFILPHDIEPFAQRPYDETLVRARAYQNTFCSMAKSIGWSPTLFYLSSSEKKTRVIRHAGGYDIYKIPVLVKIKGSSGCISPKLLAEVGKFVRKERPDIVHIHGYYTAMFEPLCLLLWHLKVPFVVNYHGSPLNQALRKLKRATLPFALSKAKMILSPSRGELDVLKSWGVRVPMEFQPNPVDMGSFGPKDKKAVKRKLGIPPEDPVILFLARFAPEKNPFGLLKAFSRIAPKFRRARLIMAGGGPLLEPSKDYARKLGLKRVDFKGFVDDKTRLALFQCADVFVLPSIGQEASPHTLIEALACGTPAVASDISGVTDILIDKKDGFLVEPGDEGRLESRLRELLSDSGLRSAMGKYGSNDVPKRFSFEVAARALQRNYQKALSPSR